MAFLSGIIQYRGKLGQTIGRKNGNTSVQSSVTRGQNIVGVAPESVANPQTVKQAAQRLKMRPAANFYRDLGYMLNHSWQGTKYRARSRNKFMQNALLSNDLVIPFLKKGDSRFVPGTYPLSEGALIGAEVTGFTNNIATSILNIATDFATIGELAEQIYSGNVGFLYGDKLTFVMVGMKGNSYDTAQFFPVTLQVVLDPNDTTTVADFAAANKLNLTVTGGKLCFTSTQAIQGQYSLCAAAIIQSRVPATEGGDWQRSNASLYIRETVLNIFMTAGAYNEALASYQKSDEAVNSDWYLNFGTYGSRGVSGDNSEQASLFNIGSITLPTYTDSPEVTLSNVAALSAGGLVAVIVSTNSNASTNTRDYYQKVSTNTVQVAGSVVNALTRFENAGYAVITMETAQSQFGIQLSTPQGNGGEEAGEDRP